MKTSEPVPFRRTKIVATLGPATDDPIVLAGVLAAGLDVARINCSHGTRADHTRRVTALRAAADAVGRPVAVLIDIRGPKLRVTSDGAERPLVVGAYVRVVGEANDTASLHFEDPETTVVVPVSFNPADVGAVVGHRILFDDGRLTVVIERIEADSLVARVVRGGLLKPGKGVNLPDTDVTVPVISPKDVDDLAMAVDLGADWIAVSFVSCAADLHQVRALVPSGIHLIAKIERPAAVTNYDEILFAADGVMVARGDLGVETPYEQLPMLQKDLISRANLFGVPVITATEMLESMTVSSRPTRAEVSDCVAAVIDGSDATMLSAETATGADPVNVVATMSAILAAAESSEYQRRKTAGHRFSDHEHPQTGALAAAAAELARDLHLDGIIVFTETGRAPRMVAHTRPQARLVAFCHDIAVWRRLALYWGVHPIMIERSSSTKAMVDAAQEYLVTSGLNKAGDRLVFVGGPPNIAGCADFLMLRTC